MEFQELHMHAIQEDLQQAERKKTGALIEEMAELSDKELRMWMYIP